MAYFLPSYFQKRLLRYALSRLDLIETDTLDLEDLGVTFGQRSIIELKNVGIKVNRLIDALRLPATIEITRASIDLLRLTIPADLHASGIELEVDGVHLSATITPEEQIVSTSSPKSESIPAVRAYGQSRSSHRIHDPGGRSREDSYGRTIEVSEILPSPRDVAASFLESEPLREREELQAVINSQSHHLQESAMSASLEEDTGLGMPGGLTLPAFIANFVKGIADRLSLTIRNITILISINLSPLGKGSDSVECMLKISNVVLEGLKAEAEPQFESLQRKAISIHQTDFFILTDFDLYSQTSSRSSPKLSRSHSRTDHPSCSDDAPDSENSIQSSEHGQRVPKRREMTISESQSELTLSGENLSGSTSSSSLIANFGVEAIEHWSDDLTRPSSDKMSPTHSETILKSKEPVNIRSDNSLTSKHNRKSGLSGADASDDPTLSTGDKQDDLSESKLFTHEEAESMYLSAVSNDSIKQSTREGIPGAWEWADALEEQGNVTPTQDRNLVHERSQVVDRYYAEPSFGKDISDDGQSTGLNRSLAKHQEPQNETGERVPDHFTNTAHYRIFNLDICRILVPWHQKNARTEEEKATVNTDRSVQNPNRTFATITSEGFRSVSPTENTQASTMSEFVNRRDAAIPNVTSDWTTQNGEDVLEVQAGNLTLDLDLNIAKLLLKVFQHVEDFLPHSAIISDAPKAPSDTKVKAGFSSKLSLDKANFNFCEYISRDSHTEMVDSLNAPANQNQTLLQLSMSSISHNLSIYPTSHQRLSISKIDLTHLGNSFLSFLDTVHVRDSIATSSMLRPHDLVVTKSDLRIDVQLKPIHVVLDLASMDDILNRSGGLSSLIDFGSSIVSSNTVRGSIEGVKPQPAPKRTVRFNEPGKTLSSEKSSSTPAIKVDLRVAGSVIDLVGSLATIQVKSSAIKLALRQDNIRIAIDGAAIEGPILSDKSSTADLYARLRGIQLHYSGAPEEHDLDRLLSLLTPSSDKYDEADDIMVDTLLRQRRKGAVLRISVTDIQAGAKGLGWQAHLNKLAEELSRLSNVAKYLPEDDRPGILTFALINKFEARLQPEDNFGQILLKAQLLEGSHISVPSLAAAQISSWTLYRGNDDIMIGTVVSQESAVLAPPMLMFRFIADEMEPTVRLKISNTCVEYKVQTLLAITELIRNIEESKDFTATVPSSHQLSPSSSNSETWNMSRKIKTSITFRDSAIALYPDGHPAKGLFLLSDAAFTHAGQKLGSKTNLDIKKASLLIIDDTAAIGQDYGNVDHKLFFDQNDHVQQLTKAGFVPVGSISSASAVIEVRKDKVTQEQHLDIEFRNNLLFLETCADSTQTLIHLLSGLAPSVTPSKVAKYRTEIVPIEDMLASFTGNAFVTQVGPELGLQASQLTAISENEEEHHNDQALIDDFYPEDEDEDTDDQMTESYAESRLAQSSNSASIHIAPVDVLAPEPEDYGQTMMAHSMLDFRTDHFNNKSVAGGTAHRWDSTRNTYGLGSEATFQRSPLKVRIRDVHIIWNLFDGYDWQSTRDTISQAVKELETKALARRPRSNSRLSPRTEDDDESVIGDFLFNSIYIGIPANKDPRELTAVINHDIDDLISETGSYATGTTVTASPTRRQAVARQRSQKLRLNRSKHHKIAIELEGVSADIVSFPAGSGEVESSVDVRVRKLEVFDHLPTSTWKKFATYMRDAGEREVDTNMVHIELLTVKPVADLAASELVLKVTVLPLRLHVDQDALDFFSRFFEFKDDRAPPPSVSAPPFLQRVEVNPIQVKLDFKPKRVDYGGIRSGRTTEFMNFFVLDRADMVLRRVILYGVSGFDRLGIMLNNIWMPDVKRNQLPGVLAGLAPIRPLIDVGSGVRELIAVPIREYRKDGRLVRSIQKGALAFAKTTATELINLGAKLAIGTQQVLQNTEELLVAEGQREPVDQDDETTKQISLYADQPLGIVQGLRGAYASLERDLLLAKDAIIAVPGEVMSSGSATGAAKALLKQSPTIILRPAIGASKAVGQTLLGAGNTLDRQNLRRVEEKYKKH